MSLSSLSDDDPRLLARSSALEVRLVDTAPEIEAAQALRFEVFYREMGAIASPEMAAAGRDFDKYDDICDHMLVFDRAERDAKETRASSAAIACCAAPSPKSTAAFTRRASTTSRRCWRRRVRARNI